VEFTFYINFLHQSQAKPRETNKKIVVCCFFGSSTSRTDWMKEKILFMTSGFDLFAIILHDSFVVVAAGI